MLCTDSRQNVEDEEVAIECDDEPNPQDRPAGPDVLPLDIEQNDSASVISHGEELIGLEGQECDALAPVCFVCQWEWVLLAFMLLTQVCGHALSSFGTSGNGLSSLNRTH